MVKVPPRGRSISVLLLAPCKLTLVSVPLGRQASQWCGDGRRFPSPLLLLPAPSNAPLSLLLLLRTSAPLVSCKLALVSMPMCRMMGYWCGTGSPSALTSTVAAMRPRIALVSCALLAHPPVSSLAAGCL